jgi:hypothetical protein
MNLKPALLGAALVAAALSSAPIAQADDQSYLDRLAANGVHPIATMTPGNLVAGGLQMCNLMRSGMSPQDAANSLGILSGVLGVPAVDAAQHELCPDTLN